MPDGPRAAWELGDDQPTAARIQVDAEQVATAKRQLGQAAAMTALDDGSAIFDVPVVNFEAFRTFVMGFLHRCEVLSPPEWRTEIVGWLETIETGDGR